MLTVRSSPVSGSVIVTSYGSASSVAAASAISMRKSPKDSVHEGLAAHASASASIARSALSPRSTPVNAESSGTTESSSAERTPSGVIAQDRLGEARPVGHAAEVPLLDAQGDPQVGDVGRTLDRVVAAEIDAGGFEARDGMHPSMPAAPRPPPPGGRWWRTPATPLRRSQGSRGSVRRSRGRAGRRG